MKKKKSKVESIEQEWCSTKSKQKSSTPLMSKMSIKVRNQLLESFGALRSNMYAKPGKYWEATKAVWKPSKYGCYGKILKVNWTDRVNHKRYHPGEDR